MPKHSPAPRPLRCRTPVVILLLAISGIVWVQFSETNFRPHKSVLIGLLAALLLCFWRIFFTGLPTRARLVSLLALFAGLAGIAFTLARFTRIEGSYSGMGLPRLVWKWTPKTDATLPGVAVASQATVAKENPAPSAGPEFAEFLGTGRSNAVSGLRLATNWITHPPKELWRQPVGAGWSGFVVAGNLAVTQEQRGEHELTIARDLRDGRALWAHTNAVRFSEPLGGDGPRATPTIAGSRVYALGASGILDCLEVSTGKQIWSRDVLKELGAENLTWGKSSSPLVTDGLVVVSGGQSGPLLAAYAMETGLPAWRAGTGESSYASPVLATLAGRRQVLSVNGASVTSHDPKSGAILWSYPWPGKYPKCSQPVAIASDQVLLSAGYGLGSVLLRLKPAAAGDGFAVEEVWKNRNLKTQFTNVAIRDGFAFGLDEGILSCVELATGQRRWKDGRYGHGQLLLVENLLLIQTEPGSLALVEANPDQHRELARWPALTSKTWNNVALAGDLLLVRNDREAICFRLALDNSPPSK